MKHLRRFRTPLGWFMTLLVAFWQIASGMPARAATLYWDTDGSSSLNNVDGTNIGGSGTWDTTTANWWDLTNLTTWPNTSVDEAVFSGSYVPGVPVTRTVTLVPGITANQLRFQRGGYALTGGTLTLAGTTPGIYVDMGESILIDSLIQGTNGFTKTGRGTVRLGNAGNTYTGITTVSNGSLVISNPAALGADTSAVVVTGSATHGFPGGQLVLQGGYSTGMNFTRNLSLQGLGPIGSRSAALLSVGNTVLSGTVNSGVGDVNTRITSANGLLNFTGTLDVGGIPGTTVNLLGGAVNVAGAGNYAITGALTGTGTLEKGGAGTLILNPSDTSGFSGVIRLSSSATGTQSTVRITSANVLGMRSTAGTGAVLDLNGGILEVRMDAPELLAGGAVASAFGRASSTIFVDHGIGGQAVNGTLSLNQITFEDGQTFTFNSRNGSGVTFASAVVNGGNGNSAFTNNMGGLLTFNGTFWSNSENTGNRTMTINGTGNTLITGNLTASATSFDHNLTKAGTGLLTITSTGSTLDGNVSVQAGALAITDFRSITNNTGIINLGDAANTGALIIGTSVTASAAGLTTSKVINLAGAAGGGIIYANQTGVSPVILNANFTAAAGAKTLTLGGTNTADNIINGIIADATGGLSLAKNGAGTWVLAGANTYTGGTTITNGTLKLQDTFSGSSRNVVSSGAAITFDKLAATQEAGGTLEYVGAAGSASTELVGSLVPNAGAATIKVTPGSGGTAVLTFDSLGARGAGATINYAPGAGGTIAFTTAPAVTNDIIAAAGGGAAYQTYQGVDWATLSGSNVIQYTGYTVNALPASGVAGAGVNYSQSVSTATTGDASVNTLKIVGGENAPVITLGGILTLTAKGVLFDNSAGEATITGSQLGGPSVETVIITNGTNANNALTINSLIGSGTGSLTKSGTGTLVIGGTNTYLGNTFINEGTVRLSGATATLGAITASNVTAVRQGATLDINAAGASNTVVIGGLDGAGIITNSGGGTGAAGTISIGGITSTASGTFTGILQNGAGVLHVNKNGSGVQNLLGLNTYTGATRINAGSIVVNVLADIGAASGIGAGDATSDATNAASLVFTGSNGGLTYAGALMNGSLTLGSASASTNRLFTLAGSGATITSNASNGNAVVFTNTGDIVHGLIGPQSLVLDGTSTGDNRLNPRITDSGTGVDVTSVTKRGTGKWVLGNTNNTYSGVTTVENGILELAASGSLSASSGLVLGGTTTSGILEMSGVFSRNLSATALGGAVTWNTAATSGGGGFSAAGEKLVVAIGGEGTETALVWNTGGFVKTGAALVLNSATALSEVEFRNAINLNGATRTITVNDNTNTGADFATITGVISGTGTSNLVKNGSGVLQLFGNNTYAGTTGVTGGTLVVTSLGNSANVGGTSSVGLTTNATANTSAVTLGNAGTTGGILQYVGAGEVSDRLIRLNTTTGTNQIHADGSGALILTNLLNNMTGGAKTLQLRGTSTAGNMITSLLSNNGGNLTISIDGSATWILTNAGNNYFATSVGGGALGIGANTALGTGTLTVGTGTVFAYGGDRVIGNAVSHSNNTTAAFVGDHNLTFTSTYALGATANNVTFNNTIVDGKALTLGNVTANSIDAARTFTMGGSGYTVISGNITTSTAFGLNITYNGTGTLELRGTASDWNTGLLTISNGTLKLGAGEVINHGSATDSGNVVFNPAAGATATFDLNGNVETINGLDANGAGHTIIDNSSSTTAALYFGSNDQNVNIGTTGAGDYTITNTGAGALSLIKVGAGAANIGSGATLTYQGTTSVTGGSMKIGAALNGSTGLSVTGVGSSLQVSGGITTPNSVISITVGDGSTLSLVDGTGNKLTNLSSLSLGNAGGTSSVLSLNVGDSLALNDNLNTDLLSLLSGGTLSIFAENQIVLNLTDTGLRANGTYTLVSSASGGLLAGNWVLGGVLGGFNNIQLNVTDSVITLTTGAAITGTLYWNGNAALDVWNDTANWSTDLAGSVAAGTVPGQATDVVFVANNVPGGAVTTTLEQNFRIHSLTFQASTTTPTSVTINPGASPTNRLDIAPTDPSKGISIAAGGPPVVTIAAPLRISTNQTWNVSDAASVLTLSGGLQGEADVTKTGAGRVVLSAAADLAFNTGLTTDFFINAGALEIGNVNALGSIGNNNLARVSVNTGGAFYFNGAASTFVNSLTLAGGTLSAGTATQTYSGAINVSANSFINMRDSNSATLTATARSITLSGVLSGSGSITLDSTTSGGSGGNLLTGTLTLNNNNSGWSGDLRVNAGTVIATNANALGTGLLEFINRGKIGWTGGNNVTYNLTNDITYLAGAIGEINIDNNAAGGTALPFTVNFGGEVNLGSGAGMRIFLTDGPNTVANFTGGIVLNGNASISVGGTTAGGSAVISGLGISESVAGSVLTINDDLGGWGQTNRGLTINVASTHTGGTILTDGILTLGHKDALGTGAFTVQGGTLSANTNLTGANKVMNAVNLNGTLTFAGNNSLELGGTIAATSSRTINANGTGGAKLILSGPVSLITATANSVLTLGGTGEGVLSGGFTQSGSGGDLAVSSGTWTFTGGTIQPVDDLLINGGTVNVENVLLNLVDDIVVTGATTVLNLNSAGVWGTTNPAGTSNFLFVRGGAVVNLNANDVNGVNNANLTDGILLGDGTTAGTGILDTKTFSIVAPRFDLGAIATGFDGSVIGTGSVISNYTGTDYGQGFRLFRGTISANLAGAAPILKQGFGDVTLSGDNSGLTGGTNAATRIDSGNLILDYSIHNTLKIPSNRALDMRGGTLTVKGNASAATTLNVLSTTLANNGASTITAISNGQTTTINLGAITRTALATDGTIRFNLPVLGNITTTTGNTFGALGGWATVKDTAGNVNFAANDGANNIVAVATTAQDDISLWADGQHITDSTGFTGSRLTAGIYSLRFNANAASNVNILSGGTLSIATGGILMTSNVATGSHSISGGILSSSNGELIFTQDSTAQSLTVSSSILTGGITKAGAGSLILNGVNHYTGPTNLQAGTLRVAGGFAIGDSSVITFADDQANTLVLDADEVVGSIAGGTTTTGLVSGTVDIGTHTLTLRNGADFNGTLTGSGTLVLDSVGTTNFNITSSITTAFTGNVVVNNGLFLLSGSAGRLNAATSFTINKGGSFLIDNNDDSSPNDRLSNTAAFTLHSADGVSGATTPVRGLWIRTNNNGDETETIGALTLGSGASYFSGEASGGTNAIAGIATDNILRSNGATLNLRGVNLGGGTGAARSQLRISTAGNQTAFIGTGNNANMVGGGGAAGSKNISIVPWAIGENAAALADANMGNSLVTYVSGTGFRALDFTTEYSTFASRGSATDHNVRESLTTTDLTGLASATVNALVLHNNNTAASSVDVLGNGAGQTLAVTSGAMLFTLNSAAASGSAHEITLGGFDGGITMGGAGITNEYVIHVVNPSSAAGAATLTASITSSLTSTADITKAGRGTLILTATNTAGGGSNKTTINEGVLQIADLDNIGGNTGGIVFAGGTLRLASGFADDISIRPITMLQGGGTLDTNGMDFVLANSIGGGGAGGFTKAGLGSLTLAASATYTGRTTVADGRLILGGGGNNRLTTGAAVVIGSGATSGVLQLGNGTGASDQIVTELSSSGTGTANAIVGGNAAVSVLTINQNTVATYAGAIGGLNPNENNLSLVKTGVGILTLSGGTLSYTGTTTVTGGVLAITGSAASALATTGVIVSGNAALYTLNGAGQSVNLGAGTLNLGAGSGAAVLGMELGSTGAYDSYNTTAAAITANSVVFNLTGLTGFGAGTYNLLTASGGLNNATYAIGSVAGALNGVTLSLQVDPTFVRLNAVASTGDFYWRGGINNSWMGSSGLNTNFTTDLAGTINANGTPGAASTVIFSAQNVTGPAITTTLDASFTVNNLRFLASPTGVTSVTIASGTPSSSTLTIAPSSSGVGIEVADNAGAITIAAPLILGANQTWSVAGTGVNGSSLTVSGAISGVGSLEKTGLGILTVSGAGTYTGATTITEGILQASGSSNRFSAASAYTVGASGILRLNGLSNAIGSLAGSGIVENNGTANITLTTGANNTSTLFSGILRNGSTGTLGLTKTGNGVLTLSGSSSSMTGAVTVNGGVLAITGAFDNGVGATTVGSSAGTKGMLYVAPGSSYTTTTLTAGGNATGPGSIVINGGTVATTTATVSSGVLLGGGGYGGLFISNGGSLTTHRVENNSTNTNSVSVIRVDGGSLTADDYIILRNHRWEFTVTGGNVFHNAASNNIALGYTGTNTFGAMTVAGGTVDNTGRNISFGQGGTTSITASLNLNAGTLITNPVTVGTGATSYINFNGGTLKASASSTTFLPTAVTAAYVNGAFGTFNGGAVVDTNGFDITFAESLLAPTGDGVSGLSVGSGGSGYVGAPYVEITGGGGTGATGYAVVDLDPSSPTFGQVTAVVLTNPGVNYTSTPTVTLVGGGGTGASVSAAGLIANTSGGLTKIGTGTLTLSGTNTYTGGTTVTAGTLALGVANALADTGAVTVNGGTFNVATFNDTVGTVTLQSGSITGTTGVLTGSSYVFESGTVSAILAGTGSLTKNTGGTVTLSGANTFSGAVNINGGVLAFSTAANLGDGSATNGINFNGGALNYTGSGAVALAAAKSVTVGAGGATFDVSNATGVLTVAGNVTGSAGGGLVKTGNGTLVLGGTNNLGAGGATNVVEGTLRAGFGSNGTSTITVSGVGTLELVNNAAQTLTLAGTTGALTLSGGATLGFELGAPSAGNYDAIIVAAGGTAVVNGVITLNLYNLGSMAAGTYDLISILGGGGGLNAATNFVLGNAPAGFNYSINRTDTMVQLIASALNQKYWNGFNGDGSWSSLISGTDTNWSNNAAGDALSSITPGATDTVIFSAQNAPSTNIFTTLDGSRTIDSLQFISAPTGVTAVTIAQGSGGTLTISPATATNGIFVAANGGDILIQAPVIAAVAQTWSVDGTGLSSLTIEGNTTFNGRVSKTGSGFLTLSGNNSGTGGIDLMAGTLNINSATALGTGSFTIGTGVTINNTSANPVVLSTNNTMLWEGDFAFTGTRDLNLGTGAVTMGASLLVNTAASTLTVGGVIGDGASDFTLTKAGAGALTLSGANTWSGGMVLNAGTLNMGSSTALGTGLFTINGGTINNTSGGVLNLANYLMQWNGSFTFTGTNSMNMGTGAVTLGNNVTVTASANNLTVGGVIDDGASSFSLTKAGAGNLILTNNSTYGGATVIENGTVTLGVDNALPTGTALTVGSGTTAATLNLGAFSQTVGSLTSNANTNSAAIISNITVATGETLTVNGNVLVGSNSDNAYSNLTIAGGGALVVNGTSFTVGQNTTGTNSSSRANVNLSGLSSFTANLTGALTVQLQGDNDSSHISTLTLSNTANSITAASVTVGGSATAGTQVLVLGAGTNQINANTVNIGTGGRDGGSFTFGANATGSIVIRDTAGTGRAAFNMGTGGATTGVAATNVFNVSGHHADLLLGAVNIGTQASRTSPLTSTFSFDQGTLDMTSLTMSTRTSNPSGTTSTAARNTTSIMNIGGGQVSIQNGILNMARAAGDYSAIGPAPIMSATLNISGGTVNIGQTGGIAIRMADYVATGGTGTGSATGLVNITGGTVTVNGDIVRATVANSSATVTLNGASAVLDMTGDDIGTATNVVTFNAQQGTLMNLGELNGGAGLTKSGLLLLILEGLNTYTGGTNVTGGVLQVGSGAGTGNLGSGTVNISDSNAIVRFNRNNTYTVANTITGTGKVEQTGTGVTVLEGNNDYSGGTSINAGTLQVNSLGALGTVGEIKFASTGGILQHTANNTVDYSARIANSSAAMRIDTNGQTVTYASALAATNTGGLNKLGTGTLRLGAANAYAGGTTVSAGTLVANNSAALSTGSVTVDSAGTLSIGDGSRLNVNVGGSLLSSGTLQFDIFNRQDDSNPVTNNDLLTLTSANAADTITLTGTLRVVDTTGTSATTWDVDDVWKLIDWTGFAGAVPAPSTSFAGFSTLDLPTLGTGLEWKTFTDTTGLYISVVVVPEPSRMILLGLGFVLVTFRRRRRQA